MNSLKDKTYTYNISTGYNRRYDDFAYDYFVEKKYYIDDEYSFDDIKEKEQWLKERGYPIEPIDLLINVYRIKTIGLDKLGDFLKTGNYKTKIKYNFSNIKYITKDALQELNSILNIENLNIEFEHKDMVLSTNTIAEIDDKTIEDFKIDKVIIGSSENSREEVLSIDKYRKIRNKLEEIVDGIDMDSDEIEKFKTIYTRLANMLVYDEEAIQDGTPYAKENVKKSRNLENALFLGKCVCTGFAETLKQALSLVGIKSHVISSESDNEGINHAYNIVKINGRWLNTDLTWDATNIRNKEPLKYCLKNDKDFRRTDEEEECYHTPKIDVYQCTGESLEIYPEFSINKLWDQIKLLGKTLGKGIKTVGLINLLKKIKQEREKEKIEPIMLEKGSNKEEFKQKIQEGIPSMEEQKKIVQNFTNKEEKNFTDEEKNR